MAGSGVAVELGLGTVDGAADGVMLGIGVAVLCGVGAAVTGLTVVGVGAGVPV
ncbi:MAG: hypothetical protein FWC62_01010 [Firmicutes bacterium]|nr:hypothetical protein [Bacillota bacterium]